MWLIFGLLFAISSTLTSAESSALILTPYISSNQTDEGRKLSAVDPSLFLNVTSHSGFLTVDADLGSHIFFWYFPIMNKPVNETPWMIWLQGGPGATSLAGLFDEIGPFEYNGELKLREWSWTKNYSIIFIDNPIGSGYSFTNSPDGFAKDLATSTNHLFAAIKQLTILFPELQKAPLYITGESYAGHYIPDLALKIYNHPKEISINLQGLIMGNPLVDRETVVDFTSYFYQWGLIDSQGVINVKRQQEKYIKDVNEKNTKEAVISRNRLLNMLKSVATQPQIYNMLWGKTTEELALFKDYILKPDVRAAIHVGEIKFAFVNGSSYVMLDNDFFNKISNEVVKLLEHYRILIYCGQLDLTVPCVPNAEDRRRNWHWSGRDEFLNAPRKPWIFNNEVAGYVKSGGNFTEVLVKGAGHMAPMDKPAEMQHLISAFIQGMDVGIGVRFPKPPEYVDLSPAPQNNTAGYITSVVMNVILALAVVALVLFILRRRMKRVPTIHNEAGDVSTPDTYSEMLPRN